MSDPENIAEIVAAAGRGDSSAVAALLTEDHALLTAGTMLGAGAVHAAGLGGHLALRDALLARMGGADPWTAAELGMTARVRELRAGDASLRDARR